MKKNLRLRVEKRLPDGSYWSRIYASERDWRHQTNGVVVRVIDYRLEGVADAEPLYRLVTTILDPERSARRGIGGALSGTLGDRRSPGRTEDASARSPNHSAQQDPGLGAAGILWPADGAFRRPRLDARGGLEGGRRSRPALFSARRAGRSSQAALSTVLFPPVERKAFHEAVLEEILQERVG